MENTRTPLATGRPGMGWLPDLPDIRDFSLEHEKVKALLDGIGLADADGTKDLPDRVDLREYCSPIEEQGPINSCTAQTGVALIEYFERRAFGRHLDASRLFLYKVTRNLMGLSGDTGAMLRATMGAMVLFGVPPEMHWPYVTALPQASDPSAPHFDAEPPAFCYAFAQNFKSVNYFRLDTPDVTPRALVGRVKLLLAHKLPCMFGFTLFSSLDQARSSGCIPHPSPRERAQGGHAVVAVGYDDSVAIQNKYGGDKTTGAILIRNSWGENWGEAGYGWLPYSYVEQGMALDWWSLFRSEYVDTQQFGL